MDRVEIGRVGVDWIGVTQERDKCRAHVNVVMNLWVPSNAGKLSSGCTGSFKRLDCRSSLGSNQ
jgi:hypothetical protein